MDKEEVDGKVRELSRSGSNPAMRGVLFGNMYHKIGESTGSYYMTHISGEVIN